VGRLRQGKDIIMRTATVLVVDDLEDVRALLGEVLGFYGYAVLTAASVPEAEAIRQRLGLEGLDLVITDLRLTHLPHAREGYDLIERWHAATPQLPFILMGGDLRRDAMGPLPSRGVWCLSKPFETAALLTTIHQALR
jgi:DNA-binding NtrC family response regulator